MTDWQAILDEHGKSVWNTIYRLLGNDSDTADCFQEAFADAVIFSKKQNVRNYRAVLLKFATCRAMDILRRKIRKNQPLMLEEIDEISLQSRDCPQSCAENSELGRLLVDAFAQLDSNEAEIFCLKHINNLSATEISQIFGLKENHIGVIVDKEGSLYSPKLPDGSIYKSPRKLHNCTKNLVTSQTLFSCFHWDSVTSDGQWGAKIPHTTNGRGVFYPSGTKQLVPAPRGLVAGYIDGSAGWVKWKYLKWFQQAGALKIYYSTKMK